MSPRFQTSPRQGFGSPSQTGVHPVSLTRASPHSTGRGGTGARHQPYSLGRPPRTSLNFEQQGRSPNANKKQPPGSMRLPTEPSKVHKINLNPNEVIKIEALDEEETENSSKSVKSETKDSEMSEIKIASVSGNTESSDNTVENVPAATHSSPSQTPTPDIPSGKPSSVKDDASESSSSTNMNEPTEAAHSEMLPAEGLSLDSDLSNLTGISADGAKTDVNTNESTNSNGSQAALSDTIPHINIKTETDVDMDLEITGVEPGQLPQSDNDWMANVNARMGYGPSVSGASNQSPMLSGQADQDYGKFIFYHYLF